MDGRRSMALGVLLATALSGCGDRAAKPDGPPAARGGAAQPPVNPDPAITAYACGDGETITAGYPDRDTAVVTYKDHAYTLKRVRSASGARYTGYGLQWWVKGAQASIAPLSPGEAVARAPGLRCAAAQNPPPPELTRTGFSTGSRQIRRQPGRPAPI